MNRKWTAIDRAIDHQADTQALLNQIARLVEQARSSNRAANVELSSMPQNKAA